MARNSNAARNAANSEAVSKPVFTVKRTEDKKFDSSEAETVTPIEETEEKTNPVIPIQENTEPQPTEPTGQTQPEAQKPENNPETSTHPAEKKVYSTQDYKDRAMVVYLLQDKHTKLTAEKNRIESFEISHDKNDAKITVEDSNFQSFTTTAPQAIKAFLDFIKKEYQQEIDEVESSLKNSFLFD